MRCRAAPQANAPCQRICRDSLVTRVADGVTKAVWTRNGTNPCQGIARLTSEVPLAFVAIGAVIIGPTSNKQGPGGRGSEVGTSPPTSTPGALARLVLMSANVCRCAVVVKDPTRVAPHGVPTVVNTVRGVTSRTKAAPVVNRPLPVSMHELSTCVDTFRPA